MKRPTWSKFIRWNYASNISIDESINIVKILYDLRLIFFTYYSSVLFDTCDLIWIEEWLMRKKVICYEFSY